MLNPDFRHRASYDAEGNIILPKEQVEEIHAPEIPHEEIIQWIVVDDDAADLHQPDLPEAIHPAGPSLGKRATGMVLQQIVALRSGTRSSLREGARQYRVTINGSRPILQAIGEDVGRVGRAVWRFLMQPVWVPTRKRQIKQYSHGTLFVVDILRFGGTFAMIFLALFVALNYQSFWEITRSKVLTIVSGPSINAPEGRDSAMVDSLKAQMSAVQDGRERGELLSFLPPVGPPENRVVIAKLGLNVPLTEPSTEALLKQDWAQVEVDIQHALQDGVVHYPGTARPGQAGNFFITGHSSYYPWAPGKYKTVFARLHELKPGDEYWVYYKGDRHRYIVQEKKEVFPGDVSVLDQPDDKRISTLMTCTPVGTTLRRLIVIAQEVDPLSGKPLHVGERGETEVKPSPKLEALPI